MLFFFIFLSLAIYGAQILIILNAMNIKLIYETWIKKAYCQNITFLWIRKFLKNLNFFFYQGDTRNLEYIRDLNVSLDKNDTKWSNLLDKIG